MIAALFPLRAACSLSICDKALCIACRFVGRVRHEVGDKYIRNIAIPPHFLYPGTVTRTVITESNQISILTEGTGAGGAAAVNELSAKPLWKSVDQNIIDAVE